MFWMDNGKAQDDRASMTKMELVGGAGGGDDALGIPSKGRVHQRR